MFNESCPNYCYDVFDVPGYVTDVLGYDDAVAVICAGNVTVIANDSVADVP